MKIVLTTTLAGLLVAGSALAAGTEASAQAGTTGQTGVTTGQTGAAADQVQMQATAGADIGAQLDAESIRQIQQALADAGHYEGEIDGIWGPRTEAALRQYQTAQGLGAQAGLDQQTLAALGLPDIDVDAAGMGTAEGGVQPLGTGQAGAIGQAGQTGTVTGAEQATGTGLATGTGQGGATGPAPESNQATGTGLATGADTATGTNTATEGDVATGAGQAIGSTNSQ